MKSKWLALFCFVLVAFTGYAQDITRVEVFGKIVVDSVDVEGVTVFNTSSNRGTITDVDGQFTIEVTLNDRLEISALQFEPFEVIVNADIMASRVLTVFLIERINRLDEILILPYGLSGNLSVDVESVKTFNPDMDAIYFGIQNMDEYEFPDDYQSGVINLAMEDGRYYNGADAVKIVDMLIRPLFRSKKSDTASANSYESLTEKFSLDYLMRNLEIPQDQINEFVVYVEDGDFDRSLMEPGKEIQFLDYLIEQSAYFKKAKADDD